MLIGLSVLFGVPLLWLMIKAAKWSAPITGTIGLLVFWSGTVSGGSRAMQFGGGLFVFSVVLFVLGNGMKGR